MVAVYRRYVGEVEGWVRKGFFDQKKGIRAFGIANYDVQLEIIQEVFLRAFSERARLAYDGVRPYHNFLFSISRNVIIDFSRKRKTDALGHVSNLPRERESAPPEGSLDDYAPVVEDDMEEKLHWQRCLEASEVYITTLNDIKQQFIRMRFQQELPQEEVAKALGLSRWKVRSLERRLQVDLTDHLKREKLLS